MSLQSELGPVAHQFDGRNYSARIEAPVRFRNFSLHPADRVLKREMQAVAIGDRAFDLLQLLLDRRGTVVSKKEILSHVWPSITVSESNLRFQITSLRKALGKDRDLIRTVTGRGYLFVSDRGAHTGVELSIAGPGTSAPAYRAMLASDCHADTLATAQGWNEPSIIVVGDDRGVCEGLRGFLQLAGVRVQLFGTVTDFLAQIRSTAAA
jgi:DNA-binding winged helix-turn-helix (wHTH) protein